MNVSRTFYGLKLISYLKWRDWIRGGAGMFAVIETGGKQYRVSEGDVLRVEKLNAEVLL